MVLNLLHVNIIDLIKQDAVRTLGLWGKENDMVEGAFAMLE